MKVVLEKKLTYHILKMGMNFWRSCMNWKSVLKISKVIYFWWFVYWITNLIIFSNFLYDTLGVLPMTSCQNWWYFIGCTPSLSNKSSIKFICFDTPDLSLNYQKLLILDIRCVIFDTSYFIFTLFQSISLLLKQKEFINEKLYSKSLK